MPHASAGGSRAARALGADDGSHVVETTPSRRAPSLPSNVGSRKLWPQRRRRRGLSSFAASGKRMGPWLSKAVRNVATPSGRAASTRATASASSPDPAYAVAATLPPSEQNSAVNAAAPAQPGFPTPATIEARRQPRTLYA